MPPDRFPIQEYEPFKVDQALAADIRDTLSQTERAIRPRFSLFSETNRGIIVGNLVGSVRLHSGTVLDVYPKFDVGSDWTSAVIDLLDTESRIDIHSNRDASFTHNKPNLGDALAIEYARRLQAVLEHDGPLQVLQSQAKETRRLSGRLDVTRWLRRASLTPHIFPVTVEEFTTHNDFSRAMAFTASVLARGTRHVTVRSKLLRLADRLTPGQAPPLHVPPVMQYRPLPQQWKAYEPVWSLVLVVLRNQALLNSTGQLGGLEVAVEPWPLLETLLARVLSVLAQHLSSETSHFELATKRPYTFLHVDQSASTDHTFRQARRPRDLIPDGVLLCNGVPCATFEAKYTHFYGAPEEAHVYQALTAAAVLGCPLACLIYPGAFNAVRYSVQGFSGHPAKLVAVGLDMYSYRRSDGNVQRAETLNRILSAIHVFR